MMSRSESLPITIETSGLLIVACSQCLILLILNKTFTTEAPRHRENFLIFLLVFSVTLCLCGSCQPLAQAVGELFSKRPRGNVFAIVCAAKTDLPHRLVSALHGCVKIGLSGRDPENAPTRGEVRIVMLRRARVKDLNSRNFLRLFEPADFLPN